MVMSVSQKKGDRIDFTSLEPEVRRFLWVTSHSLRSVLRYSQWLQYNHGSLCLMWTLSSHRITGIPIYSRKHYYLLFKFNWVFKTQANPFIIYSCLILWRVTGAYPRHLRVKTNNILDSQDHKSETQIFRKFLLNTDCQKLSQSLEGNTCFS